MCDRDITVMMPISTCVCNGIEKKVRSTRIDACLAPIIWRMNNQQRIVTNNCCCHHGDKRYENQPEIWIESNSVAPAIQFGYDVRKENDYHIGEDEYWIETEGQSYGIKLSPNMKTEGNKVLNMDSLSTKHGFLIHENYYEGKRLVRLEHSELVEMRCERCDKYLGNCEKHLVYLLYYTMCDNCLFKE